MAATEKKTVWITGAGSGIGYALTRYYLGEGWTVYATDIQRQKLEKIEEKECHRKTLDVTDREAVEKALAEMMEEGGGKLDMVIHAAGIASAGLFEAIPPESWRHILEVNLSGTFHVCQVAYRKMLEQGEGHLVVISSMYGLIGTPAAAAYVASKHGIVGMTESLFHEGKAHGIAVTTVCSGFIDTPFIEGGIYHGIDREALRKDLPFPLMTTERAVKKVSRAIEKKERMVIFPRYVYGYHWISRYAPWLLRRIYGNFLKKIEKAGKG